MAVSLDIMLSKPGIYLIVVPAGVAFVESLPGGKCVQLTLDDFRPDGELEAGGWLPQNIGAIYGPLVRPGKAEAALKAVFHHWNEFGPECGFGELMDRIEK